MKFRLDAATTKLLSEIIIVMWFLWWTTVSFRLKCYLKWISRYLGLLLSPQLKCRMSSVLKFLVLTPQKKGDVKNQIRVSLKPQCEFIAIDFPFRKSALAFFQCRLFSMLYKSRFVISLSSSCFHRQKKK